MSKQNAIIVAIGLVCLAGFKVNTEYKALKDQINEAKQEAIEIARSGKAALDAIKKTADDLRAKVLRQEEELKQAQQAFQESTLKADLLQQQLKATFEAEMRSKAKPIEIPKQPEKITAKEASANEADASNQIRDSPKPVPKAKVIMHSGANCQPCKQWKLTELPRWKRSGWEVEVIEETTTSKPWPWFEVCDGGVCLIVDGPLTAASLANAKSKGTK